MSLLRNSLNVLLDIRVGWTKLRKQWMTPELHIQIIRQTWSEPHIYSFSLVNDRLDISITEISWKEKIVWLVIYWIKYWSLAPEAGNTRNELFVINVLIWGSIFILEQSWSKCSFRCVGNCAHFSTFFPRLCQVAIFVDWHELDCAELGGTTRCVGIVALGHCNFGVIFEVNICLCLH